MSLSFIFLYLQSVRFRLQTNKFVEDFYLKNTKYRNELKYERTYFNSKLIKVTLLYFKTI